MFNLGLPELVLLFFIALPVWAVIDAAILPDSEWAAADQSKLVWVLVVLLIPIIGTVVYFLAIRPKVRAAGRS